MKIIKGFNANHYDLPKYLDDNPVGEFILECIQGSIIYIKDGKRHRTDGPAVIWNSGKTYYWFNGNHFPEIKTDKEFIRFVKLMAFK